MPAEAIKTETETENQEKRVQNTLARSTLYQFLSLCFAEPNKKTFPILSDEDYLGNVQESLDTYLAIGDNNDSPEVTSNIKKTAQLVGDALREKTYDDIYSEYSKTFGTYVSSKECPIYETFYGKLDIFQQTQELADISGFYRAFDLKSSEDVRKDKFDHLSVELEFMHYLTYKEAYAIENHGDEQLSICHDAEKRFMKGHLGRWINLFTVLVNKNSPKEGFYALGADLLLSFIKLEWKYLKVKPEEVKVLNDEAFKPLKDEDFQCGPGGTCDAAPDLPPNMGSMS